MQIDLDLFVRSMIRQLPKAIAIAVKPRQTVPKIVNTLVNLSDVKPLVNLGKRRVLG